MHHKASFFEHHDFAGQGFDQLFILEMLRAAGGLVEGCIKLDKKGFLGAVMVEASGQL